DGRHGENFELMHRFRFLPVRGSQAIGASIAAADDDHILAGSENGLRQVNILAGYAPILLRKKIHREMNAVQLAPGNQEIPRLFGAYRDQNRVEAARQAMDGS